MDVFDGLRITEVCVKRMLSPWFYPNVLYNLSSLFKRQQKYTSILYKFVENVRLSSVLFSTYLLDNTKRRFYNINYVLTSAKIVLFLFIFDSFCIKLIIRITLPRTKRQWISTKAKGT